MLTKKDFKAVAEIIKKRTESNCWLPHSTSKFLYADDLAGDLADYFTTQNPCFDCERFMKACGLEHDCKRNGFHDVSVPVECEDRECNKCPLSNITRRSRGCPYLENTE
jgi:hypothetical protein